MHVCIYTSYLGNDRILRRLMPGNECGIGGVVRQCNTLQLTVANARVDNDGCAIVTNCG